MIGVIMFFVALCALLIGFPVAFTFGAVSIIFSFIAGIFEAIKSNETLLDGLQYGVDMFAFMPYRIWTIMNNTLLMAVPLFIFMGIILEKSKLAERLLVSMGYLFGKIRGGVAVSTVLVGSLLAASTGVVGASVIAMGVISLPVMLKHKYQKELATGTICASGTLGQIIPPSIVLIILGDIFQIPVGDLFKAAILPGLFLIFAYIVYILIYSYIKKDVAPTIVLHDNQDSKVKQIFKVFKAIIPTLALIILVLGSIFMGIATPTESAAVGSVGAIILAFIYKEFSFSMVYQASLKTIKITAIVLAILIGATAFSMVFTYTGGDAIIEEFIYGLPGEKWGFILFSMFIIMILGFFIDFIEIAYIIVPVLIPISKTIGINPIWFAILIAMNLQTSFLTPPFGFSLFYLKGVSPPSVRTVHIYKGVIPFIIIQIVVLLLLTFYPELFNISKVP